MALDNSVQKQEHRLWEKVESQGEPLGDKAANFLCNGPDCKKFRLYGIYMCVYMYVYTYIWDTYISHNIKITIMGILLEVCVCVCVCVYTSLLELFNFVSKGRGKDVDVLWGGGGHNEHGFVSIGFFFTKTLGPLLVDTYH